MQQASLLERKVGLKATVACAAADAPARSTFMLHGGFWETELELNLILVNIRDNEVIAPPLPTVS